MEQITRAIDAEIEKLQRVRAILSGLVEPTTPKPARPRHIPLKKAVEVQAPQEPQVEVVVVPPRQRREYTRRARPVVYEPNALSASISSKPVFVKKVEPAAAPAQIAPPDNDALETAMRRHLLG